MDGLPLDGGARVGQEPGDRRHGRVGVGGVGHEPHQLRSDDHPVGDPSDLTGLVRGADAEALSQIRAGNKSRT